VCRYIRLKIKIFCWNENIIFNYFLKIILTRKYLTDLFAKRFGPVLLLFTFVFSLLLYLKPEYIYSIWNIKSTGRTIRPNTNSTTNSKDDWFVCIIRACNMYKCASVQILWVYHLFLEKFMNLCKSLPFHINLFLTLFTHAQTHTHTHTHTHPHHLCERNAAYV